MKDYQRQRLYNWENAEPWMVKKSDLTESEVLYIIKELDKIFKNDWAIKETQVQFSNGRGMSWANKSKIKLKRDWALTWGVVLHEYAHVITDDKHGPEFVAIFCGLINRYHPDKPCLKGMAKTLGEYGLDFKSLKTLEDRVAISKQPDIDISKAPIVKSKSRAVTPEQKRNNKFRAKTKELLKAWERKRWALGVDSDLHKFEFEIERVYDSHWGLELYVRKTGWIYGNQIPERFEWELEDTYDNWKDAYYWLAGEVVEVWELFFTSPPNVMGEDKPTERKRVKKSGQSQEAKDKKVYYNRARRRLVKHGFEIIYEGEHKNYRSVTFKNNETLFIQEAQDSAPLNIDWKRVYTTLENLGYKDAIR